MNVSRDANNYNELYDDQDGTQRPSMIMVKNIDNEP
jgi:hypothetical protein